MRNSSSNDSREEDRNKETSSSPSNSESRFNQTLRNVQGLLKGRSFPGKILITRRTDPLDLSSLHSPNSGPRSLESDIHHRKQVDKSTEDEVENRSSTKASSSVNDTKSSTTGSENTSKEVHRSTVGARATDSARLMKFTKELSGSSVFLDRREGVLRRKRLEYLDCVAQYYDIPDSERTDEEINMLRQIAVDCPRTVPDVSFFQQEEVQKSLERILYIWAIRHPASGYVQGINDLATPFLVVFLSEYLEGSVDTWSMANLSSEQVSNVEADCYWCLTKLLDGMQDHYTFAQPGIQRLVFKLKELVRRIDEPVSRHMEEQGLEFLQFSFRWFNCLLIREIPFRLVTRLWDTYLAEGDALPDFLVYIFASFLLTWSDKLQKLEFQEMVMFLQHVPTQNWSDVELEMVLSQAYMWHTMFNNSPSHFLAG
ncbi:TBC1 domain family member 22B isoform X2 [Sesamum indicum]|uniref:TBC1 domain family member 22B isoform X2 n=1 Tax=Sesamum indicum TaxID=4182 RepID=A0A6I9SWS2_SESIN|nr:TBC1 domain family member 22B isoform X2 [Sesamum indicum]